PPRSWRRPAARATPLSARVARTVVPRRRVCGPNGRNRMSERRSDRSQHPGGVNMADDHDESTTPKCLFCSQRREGQRYAFWGGFHLSTETNRAFLSRTTTITSKYRDMKRVGAFVCNACARRYVALSSLPMIVIGVACAVGFGVAAMMIP